MKSVRQFGPILPLTITLALGAGCASSRFEQNKAVVLANAQAYNEHDVPGLRATLAPDLKRRCQATPDIEVRSAEDFIAFAEREWVTFPDGRLDVERLVAEGDRVGVFGRFSGTQQGPMDPFPPSNRRVDLDFGGVFTIKDGRIAEIWITWDNLTALTQLQHWPDNSAAQDASAEDAPAELVSAIPVRERESGVAYVPSTALLPCEIRLPSGFQADAEHDLVLALHGFGSSAERFAELAEPFTDEGMILAAPQAPTPFLVNDHIGYDWDRAHDEPDGSALRTSFGRASVGYLADVIAALKSQYKIRHVYLFGFSQGGAFASVVGIYHSDDVAGIISVGMGLDPGWFEDGILESGSSVPVLFLHSSEDARIPIAFARDSAERLSDLGYDVTLLEYDGGHRVTEQVLSSAIEWLRNNDE
jgi:predicted esterase/predicted ester cyclase